MLGNGETQKEAIRPDFNRSIFIDFAGAKITSDAGFLLMREVDQRFGIIESGCNHLVDDRSASHNHLFHPVAGKRGAHEVDQATPTKTCWTPTEKRGAAKVRGPGIPGGELGKTPAGGREDRVAFWGTVSPVLFHRDQFKACSE